MDKYFSKFSASKTDDKQRNKRKFKDEYIEFGFIAIEAEDPHIPFCLIYNKKHANEALVPSKLKRHLETPHPETKNQPRASRRIEDLSSDLKEQILEHFETHDNKLYSLHIDESTDISGKAQLLASIQFVKDGKFLNEFLFAKI